MVKIGYSRLILHPDRRVTYYERLLCTRSHPKIFDPNDFEWRWSKPKKTVKKEQLSALHGIHRKTGRKWWAWHGLGENQLHFSGENTWWPSDENSHVVTFNFPTEDERMSLDKFVKLLSGVDLPN